MHVVLPFFNNGVLGEGCTVQQILDDHRFSMSSPVEWSIDSWEKNSESGNTRFDIDGDGTWDIYQQVSADETTVTYSKEASCSLTGSITLSALTFAQKGSSATIVFTSDIVPAAETTVEAPASPTAEEIAAAQAALEAAQAEQTATETTAETPADVPAAASGSYTVTSGDCLWTIAKNTYGDGNLWKQIYEVNKDTVKAPNYVIYPGQTLLIP